MNISFFPFVWYTTIHDRRNVFYVSATFKERSFWHWNKNIQINFKLKPLGQSLYSDWSEPRTYWRPFIGSGDGVDNPWAAELPRSEWRWLSAWLASIARIKAGTRGLAGVESEDKTLGRDRGPSSDGWTNACNQLHTEADDASIEWWRQRVLLLGLLVWYINWWISEWNVYDAAD